MYTRRPCYWFTSFNPPYSQNLIEIVPKINAKIGERTVTSLEKCYILITIHLIWKADFQILFTISSVFYVFCAKENQDAIFNYLINIVIIIIHGWIWSCAITLKNVHPPLLLKRMRDLYERNRRSSNYLHLPWFSALIAENLSYRMGIQSFS